MSVNGKAGLELQRKTTGGRLSAEPAQNRLLAGLQLQYKPQTPIDGAGQERREISLTTLELLQIERHEVRHIGYRIFGKTGLILWDENVSGRVAVPKIRGQRYSDDRPYCAAIECIALHNHDRAAKARAGSLWKCQFSPPDFTAPNYHVDRLSVRSATIRSASSSWPFSTP